MGIMIMCMADKRNKPPAIIITNGNIDIRAVQNNSGMSDEALLLRRLLGHVTG